MEKVAVYPGSFDPITNGHLDLLERALKIFDRIVIAVAANPGKGPLFTLQERVDLIKDSLKGHPLEDRVEVDTFHGLLVEYVKKAKANAIIRGLRAISDFEYEFQMALMNRKLSTDVETLFLMTGMRYIYISSSIIKEVVMAGGCVNGLVPDPVERKLAERLTLAQTGDSETNVTG
jgi:pantetheine-phosphate adenylyltransferase